MKDKRNIQLSKIVPILGIATNALVALVMLIILYSLFYPYDPVSIKITTKELEVKPGQEITLYLIGDKKISIPVEAFIELVDGGNYPVMSYFENNPVGGFNKIKKFIVPNVKAGKYKVRWTGKYKVNCIREIDKAVYSNEIEIKRKEG